MLNRPNNNKSKLQPKSFFYHRLIWRLLSQLCLQLWSETVSRSAALHIQMSSFVQPAVQNGQFEITVKENDERDQKNESWQSRDRNSFSDMIQTLLLIVFIYNIMFLSFEDELFPLKTKKSFCVIFTAMRSSGGNEHLNIDFYFTVA